MIAGRNNLLLILCAFLFGSCASSSYTYVKTIPNTPYFTDGGDRSVNFYFGTNKLESQIAISPAQNFAVQTNSYLSNSLKYGELLIGYYKPFKEVFVWHVDAGTGYGSINKSYMFNTIRTVSSKDQLATRSADCQYSRYVAQAGVAFVNDWIKLGVTLRGSYAHYYQYEFEETIIIGDVYNPRDPNYVEVTNNVSRDNVDLFSLTPCFHFEAGGKVIAGVIKIGQSIPMEGYQYIPNRYPRSNPYILTTGLRWSPGERKRKTTF